MALGSILVISTDNVCNIKAAGFKPAMTSSFDIWYSAKHIFFVLKVEFGEKKVLIENITSYVTTWINIAYLSFGGLLL